MATRNPIEEMAVVRRDFREWKKREQEAERKIAELGEKYPELRVRFAEILHQKMTLKTWQTTEDFLYALEREVALAANNLKPPQST